LLSNVDLLTDELRAAQVEWNAIVKDIENLDSPEAVAGLHAVGPRIIDYSGDLIDLYRQAADTVGDPEVSDWFVFSADLLEASDLAFGRWAAEYDGNRDMTRYVDVERYNELMEQSFEFSPSVLSYPVDTCGYSDFSY
jgi:hypothetical protein